MSKCQLQFKSHCSSVRWQVSFQQRIMLLLWCKAMDDIRKTSAGGRWAFISVSFRHLRIRRPNCLDEWNKDNVRVTLTSFLFERKRLNSEFFLNVWFGSREINVTLCVCHQRPKSELFISKGGRNSEAEKTSQDEKEGCWLRGSRCLHSAPDIYTLITAAIEVPPPHTLQIDL